MVKIKHLLGSRLVAGLWILAPATEVRILSSQPSSLIRKNMKNSLFYVTTNTGKFAEVSKCAQLLGAPVILHQAAIDTPEIQSDNQKEIAIDKALKAWEILRKPLLVDDAGLFITRYYNFPGTFSKYVMQSIGYAGLAALINPGEAAAFKLTMVFVNAQGTPFCFGGIMQGSVITPPSIEPSRSFPYNAFFVPEGQTRTLAALEAEPGLKKELSYREKALKNFLDWYQEENNIHI